jgi:hypothetical protein
MSALTTLTWDISNAHLHLSVCVRQALQVGQLQHRVNVTFWDLQQQQQQQQQQQ